MKEDTKLILEEIRQLRSEVKEDVRIIYAKVDANSKSITEVKSRVAIFTTVISIIIYNAGKILSFLKH